MSTSSSVPPIDQIIASTPQPTLTPIQGRPDFDKILKMQAELCQNATSVPTTLGNGVDGHLCLVMNPAEHTNRTGVLFQPPANPGAIPIILAGNDAQRAQQVRTHAEQLRLYRACNNTAQAPRKQLLAAIDPLCVASLKDVVTGFTSLTPWDLLQCLFRHYGRISDQRLADNDETLSSDWDPDAPIEGLFQRVEDGSRLAVAADAPIPERKLISYGYLAIQRTGLFNEDCKEWLRKPQVQKTWPNFKVHFTNASEFHNEATTSRSAGYQGAHNVTTDDIDLRETLARLAEATIADRETIAANNAQLQTLQQDLATERQRATDLHTQMLQCLQGQANAATQQIPFNNAGTNAGAPPGNNTGRRNNNRNQLRAPDGTRITSNNNYCYTHGYQIGNNHTSATCKNPGPNHNVNATAANTMGGSARGRVN